MIGILTEKPSAMRNFIKALGASSNGKGSYNGEQYTIVASRGHLYEMKKPDGQVAPELVQKYKWWDLKQLPWNENDFKWAYEMKKDAKDVLKAIKDGLDGCEEICIATDDDPSGEGELLAWEILSGLRLKPAKWTRMYFADESEKSIQKAFIGRKQLISMAKDADYIKALYRAKWDYMSMQFTRIATLCGDGKSVLRQGRLKSAMIQIVGDGLKAYNEYKKIPYYQNRFRDENGVMYTNPDEPQFPDKSKVPQPYHDSGVVMDSTGMKNTPPPKMLDLAALSSRLAAKGYKADDVLNTYQKMYENQVVSYPRTEDKEITEEQFNELLPLVDDIAAVVNVDPALLTHRVKRKTHVKEGGAHGANRPGPKVPASLDALKQKYGPIAPYIYEILAKNYLATLAEDYEYEQQKGHVKDYPKFKGVCNIPKKQGWKAVYDDEAEEDENSNAKGLGTIAKPFVYEGFAKRPPKPTMKWLMKQLEKRDVGTGATRTSTYADITNEKVKFPLLKEKKGVISMTQYGNMSYLLLPGTHIGSLDMTEKVMAEMKDIEKGRANPAECLAKVRQLVIEDIATMMKNGKVMRQTLGIDGKNAAKDKYTGNWNGTEVSFNRDWSGHHFTDEECARLCNGEEITIEGVQMSGGIYSVTGKLTNQEFNGSRFVGFEKTGSVLTEQTVNDDKYTGTWHGREVSFKKKWAGYVFSEEECVKLCNGEKLELTVTKPDGSTYGAVVALADLEYNGHKYVGANLVRFAETEDNKRYSGVWKGKEYSFNREFRGHIFTDEECRILFNGGSVEVHGLKSQKGKTYAVTGCLAEKTNSRGDIYLVYETTGLAEGADKAKSGSGSEEYSGTWNGREVKFPKNWRGHMLTDKECEMLCNGEEVSLKGIKKKDGGTYDPNIKLAEVDKGGKRTVEIEMSGFGGSPSETYSGTWRRRQVSFDRVFRGRYLTDNECESLLAGKTIPILGLTSKSGKAYDGKGRLKEENGRVFIDFSF